jgi:hypothetical protein
MKTCLLNFSTPSLGGFVISLSSGCFLDCLDSDNKMAHLYWGDAGEHFSVRVCRFSVTIIFNKGQS